MTHWLTTDGPHTDEAEAFARYGCIRVPAEAGDREASAALTRRATSAGHRPARLVERNSPNSVPSRAGRAWRAARAPLVLAGVPLAVGAWWAATMFGIAAALFAAFELPWADDR